MSKLRRLVVLLVGITGLLAVHASAAHAFLTMNHSEPLRRAGRRARLATTLTSGLLSTAGLLSAAGLAALDKPGSTATWTDGNDQPPHVR